MPAPSGQIPPPWAWWENEAPTTRAACSSAQAAGLADRLPVGLHPPAVRVEALEGHIARLIPALQNQDLVGFHPGQQRPHGVGIWELEPEMHEGREPLGGGRLGAGPGRSPGCCGRSPSHPGSGGRRPSRTRSRSRNRKLRRWLRTSRPRCSRGMDMGTSAFASGPGCQPVRLSTSCRRLRRAGAVACSTVVSP